MTGEDIGNVDNVDDSDSQNVDLAGQEVVADSDENSEDDPQTFDAEYVKTLRSEAAEHRTKGKAAQELADQRAQELWTLRVEKLGVLADPADLDLDLDALDDPQRIAELADELLAAKPHLRSRTIRQRAGQGEGTDAGSDGDLLTGLLRFGA